MENFRLPLGFRFKPSDLDLIMHLQHKAAGNPLPSIGCIEEIDLYNLEPDELFSGSGIDVRYFFVKPKKKVRVGSRFSRRVGKKTVWKGINKGKSVYNLRGTAVGLKKNFVYTLINGKNYKDNIHGGYIMDEFSLKASIPNIDGYVLCRVKKRQQKKKDEGQDQYDNSNFSKIYEVVDNNEEAMLADGEDQVRDQDFDDFIEIDELLSTEDEENSSQQLHGDHQSPPVVINTEDSGDYDNNTDRNGNQYFGTEELVSCIDFGVSDFNQDHASSLMLNTEATLNMEAPLEAAVRDPVQSVDNQPLVEKSYTREELISEIHNHNAKTLPETLHLIEEYLLGDFD